MCNFLFALMLTFCFALVRFRMRVVMVLGAVEVAFVVHRAAEVDRAVRGDALLCHIVLVPHVCGLCAVLSLTPANAPCSLLIRAHS